MSERDESVSTDVVTVGRQTESKHNLENRKQNPSSKMTMMKLLRRPQAAMKLFLAAWNLFCIFRCRLCEALTAKKLRFHSNDNHSSHRQAILSTTVATTFAFSSLLSPIVVPPAYAGVGWDGTVLQPCPTNANCVSSSTKEPPNRYLSPLQTLKDRPQAFDNAVKNLERTQATRPSSKSQQQQQQIQSIEIRPSQYYIHVEVPGTSPGSLDDIELQFTDGNTVNVRCHAQVTLPYAPFCVKKNCINGAQDQRDRLTTLAIQVLGLPFADELQMKSPDTKWTPIFFNADRVPYFDDDLY